MSDVLEKYSKELIPSVEEEMRDVLGGSDVNDDLFFGMIHYHMGWVDEGMSSRESKSGKRIRPLLCLLACAASGGDWRQALPAAAAVEIIHNFSLVHDDIQDASPTRRGRKTVWKIWGASQAINTGDAMFALAHTALERLQSRGVVDSITLRALRMMDDTCLELTRGQFSDMSFENRADVSVEEYMAMIGRKTGALLSLSAELGALVSGSGPETVDHFAAFGSDLGLAFQIRDDILGIWGDETVIGKSAATDIVARKKSLPVLHGLSKSETLRNIYFDDEYGSQNSDKDDEEFIRRIVEILDAMGSREFAELHEKRYANSAIDHLEAINPKGEAGRALYQLTGNLLHRQF
jgi:geranylgeranyl diphosphate synthase type I